LWRWKKVEKVSNFSRIAEKVRTSWVRDRSTYKPRSARPESPTNHNCQVPTPTSQNLELEHHIRIFKADKKMNCLEDWGPWFLICISFYQKRWILRSWGWRLTIHAW
jgi:hypothetical protein